MTETIHEHNGLEHLPDGITKEQLLDIVTSVRGRGQAEVAGGDCVSQISQARIRLEKLKAQRKPVIEPFEFEGETFYIRRLNYQQLVEVALSVTRDGHNVLRIHDEDGVLSVTRAVLSSCVCKADGASYFESDDLADYFESADEAPLVSALFMACNVGNPDILNTLKKT